MAKEVLLRGAKMVTILARNKVRTFKTATSKYVKKETALSLLFGKLQEKLEETQIELQRLVTGKLPQVSVNFNHIII